MYKILKVVCFFIIVLGLNQLAFAQVKSDKFGSGIKIYGKDSTYYTKLGFRFQSLFNNEWDVKNDNLSNLENYNAEMLIRRSRIKMDGWIHDKKVKYKFELALANRDISGGAGSEFSRASNMVLDAIVSYNFYNNWEIQYGQTKLPGNRERVISSGDLQFVDRSLLNSYFNLDRDVGFQLKNHHTVGNNFIVKEIFALSQGEGRNVTQGNYEGFEYTARVEALPFGEFAAKGDYIGSAIVREKKPKLAIGFTYDFNQNAVRTRSNLGNFITDATGNYYGKNLETVFADLMFKYKKVSIMAEYGYRNTKDNNPNVYNDTLAKVGAITTGNGLNLQLGYMFDNNIEIAGRTTFVNVYNGINENQYTLGLSKFFVGHKLKIQTDITYMQKETANDGLLCRAQIDIHF